MKIEIIFGVLISLAASLCFADEEDCNLDKIFDLEVNLLKEYIEHPSGKVHALFFDGIFFPIPNRYSTFHRGSSVLGIASTVHPIGYSYYGCKDGRFPRGFVEVGDFIKCTYCEKISNGKVKILEREKYKNFNLQILQDSDVKLGVIYTNSSYIQINDANEKIIKIWWDLIKKK